MMPDGRIPHENEPGRAGPDLCGLLYTGVIGPSLSMQAALRRAGAFSKSEATVLVEGPSGVGKELVTRAIHNSGPRRDREFVTVHCGRLSAQEGMVGDEVFGHERGAFTGAVTLRKSVFEEASLGTVFLDDIQDLCSSGQASLLRVVENQELVRLGGSLARPIRVDVRIICAANRDLAAAVRDGKFRADLRFRLDVCRVVVPALATRREDIPVLADYFIRRFAAKENKTIAGMTEAALELVLAYDWPGNVRELQSAMHSVVILATEEHIRPDDLRPEIVQFASLHPAGGGKLTREEEVLIRFTEESLSLCAGNVSRAAEYMGIDPHTLRRRIEKYGLRPTDSSKVPSP